MKNGPVARLILVACLLAGSTALAQEAEIDSSKPTNFYSFLDNTFEYQRVDEETSLVGYRGNVTLALSAAHLLLAEVPLLRNTKTQKFGVGDVRARYFYLPYKNDDRFFGAFGPSVDVFMPTGSFDDGLGSSSWVVSPGVTVGLMIANWIQAFPVVSYTYTSKPDTDSIPEDQKTDLHGFSIQSLIPIVFSESFFIQFTPIYSVPNIEETSTDRYSQELFASYALTPTLQLTGFWKVVPTDDNHTLRFGLTTFF